MGKKITLLFLLNVTTVHAAELTIENPLNFGVIAIRNNNSVSTTSISRNGVQLSTGQIYILNQGSPGVFTLSDLPAYSNINLSIDLPASSIMPYPGTAQFSITAVDMPPAINMGPTGTAQFKIGATLSTSGNPANNYFNGADYVIHLNLNLDY